MAASSEDYEQGYQDGYTDGFADASGEAIAEYLDAFQIAAHMSEEVELVAQECGDSSNNLVNSGAQLEKHCVQVTSPPGHSPLQPIVS